MGLHKVIGQSQFIALPGAFPCSYNTAVHNNQTAVIILCFRNNGSVIAYRGLHHMPDRFLHKIRKLHIRYSVWNMQCHIPGQDSRGSVKRKKGFTNPAVSTCRLGSGCADILISHLGGNPISAQNAMLPEGIPYAGAAPCAMLSVRISKKKPAGVS